jgi:hypothetical protein
MGSCSAQGQCLSPQSLGAAECGFVITYCGCNGESVTGLCGTNYAEAPTLGKQGSCGSAPATGSGSSLATLSRQSNSEPECLTTDGEHVYFTETAAGRVMEVPLAGGTPATLADDQDMPFGISVAVGYVFWSNEAPGGDGTIMKVPSGGGVPVTLAEGQGSPTAIAADGVDVYWINLTGNHAVMRVPVEGGTPTVLAEATSPSAIAVFASDVYWIDGNDIRTVPGVGGIASTLFKSQASPFDLAVDAQTVYWNDAGGSGTILQASKTAGKAITLATDTGTARLAVAAGSVYFTSPSSSSTTGRVMSVPAGGGATTILATGQTTPEGIAVGGSSVIWTDTDLGAIVRLSRN